MQKDHFIRDLLLAAQNAGIAQAEAYYQESDSFNVTVREGEIETYAVNTSGGLSLRGLVNGKMGFSFTEALDGDAIGMLVNNVLQSAALINDEDEQFIFEGSPAYTSVDCQGNLGEVTERLDFALALEKNARTIDPRVQALRDCIVETTHETVRLVNTRGLDLSHSADSCIAYVGTIAREGDRVTTGDAVQGTRNFAKLDANKIAHDAVEEAVAQLHASPCNSGEMPVIFRNTAMCNMLSVFSGVFSAEAAQKGLSLLKGKEGETIAAPCVTIIDDPLMPEGFATRAFDAEGVATYTKNVVENGVLKTLLHNLKTAKKAGCASTGNATRGGYMGTVAVAPSNFRISAGEKDLRTLETAMQNGLVITDVEGLHAGADAISGDFSLLSKGYLIENGERTRAVEQVTVAGNFFELLLGIAETGSDTRTTFGTVYSPSVWVKSLSVAGK